MVEIEINQVIQPAQQKRECSDDVVANSSWQLVSGQMWQRPLGPCGTCVKCHQYYGVAIHGNLIQAALNDQGAIIASCAQSVRSLPLPVVIMGGVTLRAWPHPHPSKTRKARPLET